ncbi:MAG: hypothetical protein KBE09_02290 [Candidatus Pacebacteria bacterium]|nr:hypothetical protein [Candidatus Paceibacterota bacterium]
MAKKRAKHEDDDVFPISLSTDAVRAVIGVFLTAIALFLMLSGFGVGGVAGAFAYEWLSLFLGVGYALLPLSFLISAVIFFRSFDGQQLNVIRLVSTGVFLIAALGLIEIAAPTKAGVMGSLVASPLVAAFDTIASVIFLLAFISATLIIAFEVHPIGLFNRLKEMISPEWDELDEAKDLPIDVPVTANMSDDTPEEEEVEAPEVAEPTEDPKKEKAPRGFWKGGKEEDAEIPIISASGVVYAPPPISLLSKNKGKPEVGDVKANANIIKRTLQNFGIEVEMDEVSIGPTVTRYAMKPAEGVRLAKIVTLQSNLELALAASPVRIEAPIPGKSLVGIEVPNTSRTTLGLAPMMSDPDFTESDKPLLMALGRGIAGQALYADMARMPHMLIAGATGAGKSVTIHDLVISLLYRCGPEQMRFVMIDPKRVELTLYNSIPHLLTPVITDPKKAILALKWLAKEMDRRYNVLEAEKVRDISSYHENVLKPALAREQLEEGETMPEPMPYIVVIIDELADIMQTYPRELEAGIVRLAQMSRAVGIHLVLSTQRPSVKVITGLIKANIPARIALQVASQIDSRTILDMGGAEKLLGAGDMLFLSGEMSKPKRVQAPYIPESEVKAVVQWIAKNYEHQLPDEIDFAEHANSDIIFSGTIDGGGDDGDDDELYEEARNAVLEAKKASTSYLQRKLKVGYSRAARLMDMLEERGVIGPQDGAKPRDIIGGSNSSAHDSGLEAAADQLLSEHDETR